MTRQRDDDCGGSAAARLEWLPHADIEWRIMRASPEEQALAGGARVRQFGSCSEGGRLRCLCHRNSGVFSWPLSMS
jgi:hypothetical protein